MPEESPERARRRNFSSLLILAGLFRLLSYFVVGLGAAVTAIAGVAALASGSPGNLLDLAFTSARAVGYGLLLFLGSEMIRLLVGIGRDIARMSGRWDSVVAAVPLAPD
jgi:hypothetical protein